jgi:hypothetical protein
VVASRDTDLIFSLQKLSPGIVRGFFYRFSEMIDGRKSVLVIPIDFAISALVSAIRLICDRYEVAKAEMAAIEATVPERRITR